jgi:hypothetical protein
LAPSLYVSLYSLLDFLISGSLDMRSLNAGGAGLSTESFRFGVTSAGFCLKRFLAVGVVVTSGEGLRVTGLFGVTSAGLFLERFLAVWLGEISGVGLRVIGLFWVLFLEKVIFFFEVRFDVAFCMMLEARSLAELDFTEVTFVPEDFGAGLASDVPGASKKIFFMTIPAPVALIIGVLFVSEALGDDVFSRNASRACFLMNPVVKDLTRGG